jgi:hypothetical protein
MKTKRRLFANRRQPPRPVELIAVEVNPGRGEPLPGLTAFMAAHRHTFRPGVHQIVVEHDSGCRYPTGGKCSCASGPDVRIVGRDPAAN